ncbi:formyltetrahydrofolate deformylase [Thiovulum sp. ES]|nr:formyltetrahydrofolate deformylase [Thiovulum sp. ES]
MTTYRVLIQTKDERGLVSKVSQLFSEMSLNIISNNEFVDSEEALFFMRSEIAGENCDVKKLENGLREILPRFSQIQIVDSSKRKKIVILVTKESHCLGDILMRTYDDELHSDIVGVFGNYDNLKLLVEKFDIQFETISHVNLDRESHAKIMKREIKKLEFDYIVLAKYMRILPPSFVREFKHKIINIHHSFLPAFIGANPYKQAYERGVKIIGATAHFVTDDLDEGPIIGQSITQVDHTYSWKDMQKAGRDIEKIVLSKALKLVLDDRVMLYNNRTVIF